VSLFSLPLIEQAIAGDWRISKERQIELLENACAFALIIGCILLGNALQSYC
jgi:hypothetical protein